MIFKKKHFYYKLRSGVKFKYNSIIHSKYIYEIIETIVNMKYLNKKDFILNLKVKGGETGTDIFYVNQEIFDKKIEIIK